MYTVYNNICRNTAQHLTALEHKCQQRWLIDRQLSTRNNKQPASKVKTVEIGGLIHHKLQSSSTATAGYLNSNNRSSTTVHASFTITAEVKKHKENRNR
jgi:hypothetical protein